MVTPAPDWYKRAEPELHALVEVFSDKVRARLASDPENIIRRANPFLLRVLDADNPVDLAWRILNTFMFHSEATMFGTVMENLAITVCAHTYGGQKSSTPGIDLEYMDRNGIRAAVQIKSGENWGNSTERGALRRAFQTARRILNQQHIHVRCIEGCCYGSSRKVDEGDYETIIGHDFWEEITGWEGTANAIFDIMEEHAGDGMQVERVGSHAKVLDALRRNGVTRGNAINWEMLFRFVMDPRPASDSKRGSRSPRK